MIADILKVDIPSISHTERVVNAMDILQNEDITEIVITEGGRYLYMLREIDLMNSLNTSIDKINAERGGHFVYEEEHFLKALQKLHSNDLTILPIVDKSMKYLGAVRKDDLLDYLCERYAVSNNESIIIIEQAIRDYSLAAISNIIEQEGGNVLSVFSAPARGSIQKLWVSLTIKTISIQKIVTALERYEYEIIAHMSGEEDGRMIKERFESLMTFLNV